MLHWPRFQKPFEPDGALRDIIVGGTTLADWQRLVGALPGWGYRPGWLRTGREAVSPETVAAIFGSDASYEPLRFHVGDSTVHLWFHSVDEMEFDLDPAEVQGDRSFAAVCVFLERVGQLLQKRVVLKWEGSGPVVLAWTPRVGFTMGAPDSW
jgi:hypothetical protein